MRTVRRRTGAESAVALFLTLCLSSTFCRAASTVPEAPPETLAQALEALRRSGIDVRFSTAIVTDDLLVEEPPNCKGECLLRSLLAPHALTVESPRPGIWWVVRDEARSVRGHVFEASTRQPVDRAEVRCGDLSTRTNPEGAFLLRGLPRKDLEIAITRPGFRPRTRHIALDEDRTDLRLLLEAEISETLEIGARRSIAPGPEEALSPHSPVFDDPVGELQSWAAINGHDGELSIRGDRAGRLAVVLDDHEVPEPIHLRDFGALVGLVAPVAVTERQLHHEWLPPALAERPDAVLELITRNPGPGWLQGRVGLDETGGQVSLSGSAADRRLGWLGTFRRGEPVLADELTESSEKPLYRDAFARISFALSPNRSLILRGLWAEDQFDFVRNSGPFDSDQLFVDHSHLDTWARFSAASPRRLVEWTATQSRVRRDRFGVDVESDDLSGYAIRDVRHQDQRSLRFEGSTVRGPVEWNLGGDVGEVVGSATHQDFTDVYRPPSETPPASRDSTFSHRGVRGALFAETRLRRGSWTRVLGLRVDRSSRGEEILASPRWSEAFTLGRNRFHAAAGVFHRAMRPIEIEIADGETSLRPAERTSRLSLGFNRTFHRNFSVEATAYGERVDRPWPRYENLYKPVSRFPEIEDDRVAFQPVSSRNMGLEIRLEHRSLLGNTQLQVRLASSRDRLEEGTTLPRNIDRRLRGRWSGTYRPAPRWGMSFDWTWASGAPDTPYRVELEPEPHWVAGPEYSDRLPAVHRLDVTATFDSTWRSLEIQWRLGVDNLYDHRSVRGYDTRLQLSDRDQWTLTPERSLGITPRFGLLLRF